MCLEVSVPRLALLIVIIHEDRDVGADKLHFLRNILNHLKHMVLKMGVILLNQLSFYLLNFLFIIKVLKHCSDCFNMSKSRKISCFTFMVK